MLDDGDVTLGHVRKVVRTPEGKIKLIVSIQPLVRLGAGVARFSTDRGCCDPGEAAASLDMAPAEYEAAPTWVEASDLSIPPDEIIRIAISRRSIPSFAPARLFLDGPARKLLFCAVAMTAIWTLIGLPIAARVLAPCVAVLAVGTGHWLGDS